MSDTPSASPGLPSPRTRVLYLIVVAVVLLMVRRPSVILAIAVAQLALWFIAGLSAPQLLRQVQRFWGFALFIIVSYALTSVDPALDDWVTLPIGSVSLSFNLGGIADGVLTVVRIILLIVGSQIARSGNPRAIAAGMRSLRVPELFAVSVDAVLSLLGEEGGGGGRGTGGGGGMGRRRQGAAQGDAPEAAQESFWSSIRRIGQGDVSGLVERLERQIARAESYAGGHSAEVGKTSAHDVAVVAGVSLTMLGLKAVKTLPGLPFAPGHKMVVLLPLYVMAARLTRTRFGATYTGLTMGTVAFLMGDGRYGIFEILKHLTPGLLCDALLPIMLAGGRMPGRLAWSLFGSVIGLGRFATVFAITLMAQPPAVAYALLIPGLTTDAVFGFLSGYVTFHVVRAADRVRGEVEERKKETAWASL